MTINSDILAALIFVVFGAAAILFGADFGLGTPRALGAGAMPVMVGSALCLLGGIQFLRAMKASRNGTGGGLAFRRAELRPLLLILAAVFAFAVLIVPTGLVPALAALIVIAWFAETGGHKWELAGALVVVIAIMIAIFRIGLGLPIRLFAWGF